MGFLDDIEKLKKAFKSRDIDEWLNKVLTEWYFEKLYKDLTTAKGYKSLSHTELICLLAALCDISKEELLKQLQRTSLPALQVDISKQIGNYIKTLLDIDGILYWHNISKILEKSGYRNLTIPEAENQFDNISKTPDIKACSIINKIYQRIEKYIIDDDDDYLSNNSSCDNFERVQKENGDKEFKKSNYTEAIYFYKTLAIENPKKNYRSLVDIAQCYKCQEAYKNAMDMAFFALEVMNIEQDNKDKIKNKHKARAYHIIAGCFRFLCLKELNKNLLNTALDYYENVSRYSEGTYCLGAWNAMDLELEFMRRKNNFDWKRAILLYHKFESIIKNSQSNFKDYRNDILADRDRILDWLQYDWLRNKLSKLEDFS